jgi:hypothetical protein
MKSKDQDDKNLAFNGQGGDGYSRNARTGTEQVNHWSRTESSDKLINKGRGPTVGNQDYRLMDVGPSATKDAYRAPPTTKSVPSTKFTNIDSIKGKSQDRGQGGTGVDKPKNNCSINFGPKSQY